MSLIPKNIGTFKWMNINIQRKKPIEEIPSFNKLSTKTSLKNQPILFSIFYEKILKELAFFSNQIPNIIILFFFRQLATLITAGVPIVQSLIMLSQSHPHLLFQKLMTSIKMDLEAGKTLSISLCKFPRYFDALTCQLIQVGEQTGTLTTMLQRIATHKENKMLLKKKIIQSLFYPSIILIVALLVSFIMVTFVVPRFADLFQSMQGKLPALTLFIIDISRFIRKQGWFIFILCGVSIIIFKYMKTSLPLRQTFDCMILKLPLFNRILSKMILTRFARNLAIAVSSGMPITEALKTIAKTMGNPVYTNAVFHLLAKIEKGQPLHKAMEKNTAFPAMMIQMIKIGEESGMLDEMLEKLADIYESDIEHLIANLTQALEPLIMIILGVLIGILVIAMYLPIFKLGTLM